MARNRFVWLELLVAFRATTNGNAFGLATNLYIDIESPDFRKLLPDAEELHLITLGESMTAQFQWGIYFRSAYNRSFEATSPILIGAAVPQAASTASESRRHISYTSITDFNRESRLQLGVGNRSGAGFETGLCHATLGLKMSSQ